MLAGLSQSQGVVKKQKLQKFQRPQELSRGQDGRNVGNYLVKFRSSGGMLDVYIALKFYVYVLFLNLQV